MNFFNKIKGMRLVASLAALAVCLGVRAENKIYIEPFSITDYEPVDVPVYMDNDIDVLGVQFRIELPAELELAGEPVLNPERTGNNQDLNYKGVGVIVSSWDKDPIKGNSGKLLTLKVRVKEGMLTNKQVDFGLSKVGISDLDNKFVSLPTQMVKVTLIGQEIKYAFSTPTTQVNVNPGSTFPVEVSLENNVPMGGLQFLVTLPEGCDIKSGDIKLSDRLAKGSRMVRTKRPNGALSFVLANTTTTRVCEAGEGPLFTMTVTVPEDYKTVDGTLTVSEVIVSTIPDEDGMTMGVDCNGFSIQMINNSKYVGDAQAVIAGLRNDLAAALTTIAETCPEVKDNFTGAEISAAIDAIESAVNEAAANGTLGDNYDVTVTQPAAAVSASIAKLIEDAKAAQAQWEADRVAANKAAYEASLAEIKALKEKLENMKTIVGVSNPGVDVTASVEAAAEAIAKAETEAAEAYKAVETAGNYDYKVDKEGIEALIAAIGTEAGRISANKAAYQTVLDKIADLQAKLDNMKTLVSMQYPTADVTTSIDAAQQAIETAKKEAEAALEAVATEGTFEYTVPVDEIEALIETIGTEAVRVSANNAAYESVLETIAGLQGKLDDMKTRIATEYPSVDVSEDINEAQQAIDKAKTDAQTAYEAVAKEGTFAYTVPAEEIEALIKKIIDSAISAGIGDIEMDSVDGVKYFNLQGVRIHNPQKGMMLIRVTREKSEKIVF